MKRVFSANSHDLHVSWMWLCVLCLMLGVVGCSSRATTPPLVSQPVVTPPPSALPPTYAATDALLAHLNGPLNSRHPILPATFVNMDNLDETSSLGRLIPRQMASRLTQRGYAVLEIKLRSDILVRKDAGEFILTRDPAKIRDTQNIQAVLAGSYVLARNMIFVNAQIIRMKDQVLLAAEDFTIPLDSNIRALLGQSLPPMWRESLPAP